MTATRSIGNRGSGNRLRPFVWGAAACLLLVPALAMRFFPASGVNWSGFDFLLMGTMLAIACSLYELGAWRSGDAAYRAGFGLAALTAFTTVWVNLAVGMLGSEGDAINLLFAGVLLVAVAGATLAGLRAHGMAWAMAAAALAQLAAVGVALLLGGFDPRELGFSALFALPWLASAGLFGNAAKRQATRTAG